jgi:hypothetical protein
MCLTYCEGNPIHFLTEDGLCLIPTFFVRMIKEDGSSLIYGERFHNPQECDEFIQSFDWTKFDPQEWIE